ncbi:MAG: acyl-CoA dehydrogenase family protein [Actinomycetota bacterium]|nr:acyl-CoA dehydrogenase family protein [Actinomycetota bacterium]
MNDPYGTVERDALRKTIAEFVRREITPHLDAWARADELPRELHRRAAAAGLYGIGSDSGYDGCRHRTSLASMLAGSASSAQVNRSPYSRCPTRLSDRLADGGHDVKRSGAYRGDVWNIRPIRQAAALQRRIAGQATRRTALLRYADEIA